MSIARPAARDYAAESMSAPRKDRPPGPLLVRVDPRSDTPLQTQIYAGIRRAILERVLLPGTPVPSSRALAADLGVSRTTTLLALEQLAAEGYLTSRRGAGTFVSPDLPDDGGRDAFATPVAAAKGARRRTERRPALSARTGQVVDVAPIAVRASSVPRPFRLGTPALDRFPIATWTRIARKQLGRLTFEHLDYGPPGGFPPLRQAIADYVSRSRGTRCAPDQVVVVNGAQHGLELIFQLLVDPGAAVAVEDPVYPGAVGAIAAADGRPVPVPVDAEGLDTHYLQRGAATARIVYVTPSHQFPLGVPLSLPRRLELLAWARRTGAWIVEDDYDSEFRHGARPIPCLHGLDRDGRVVYVGTFSKTLFPSLRLGFVIVPEELSPVVQRARQASDLHPATGTQAVLAEFLAGGHFDRHLRRMRREYRARLDALSDALARHCAGALTLRPTTTGLHAVVDLHGVDDRAVFEEALARELEVMPLSNYYASSSDARANGLVLGFGAVRPELLDRGAAMLAEAISAAGRKSRSS